LSFRAVVALLLVLPGGAVALASGGGPALPLEATSDAAAEGEATTDSDQESELDATRTEWSLIPALGRNTEQGFQIGGVFVFADFDPEHHPYHWRTVNTAAFSVKETPDGASVPWSSVLTQWDVTGLTRHNFRVTAEAAFSRTENEGYFGQGITADPNAISRDSTPDPDHRYQYLITEPRLRFNGSMALTKNLSLWAGTYIRYIDIGVYEGSRLELDLGAGSGVAGERILGTEPHGLFQGAVGLMWDTRDHETAPSSGLYAELSLRGAFALPAEQEIIYGGVTANLRGYLSLVDDWLVLAGRVLTDDTFGNVPFYELARGGAFQTLYLLGGATGLRGVSIGRYAGKVRVVANTELRLMYPRFWIGGHRFRLGNVAFADLGRMWTDWSSDPVLDGSGLGLRYGVGGGVRLQWGESVMIRVDVAYSPEADAVYPHWPVVTYVWYDHTF